MISRYIVGRKIVRVIQKRTEVDGGKKVMELNGLELDDGSIISFSVCETENGDEYVVKGTCTREPCSFCHATGFVDTNICQECRGSGTKRRQ